MLLNVKSATAFNVKLIKIKMLKSLLQGLKSSDLLPALKGEGSLWVVHKFVVHPFVHHQAGLQPITLSSSEDLWL